MEPSTFWDDLKIGSPLADVKELKYSATNAEVKGDYPLAKQFWLGVLTVSPADLEAIEGIERLVQVVTTLQPPTLLNKGMNLRNFEQIAKAFNDRFISRISNAHLPAQLTEPKTETSRGVEAPVQPSSPRTVKPPMPKALPRYEFEVLTVNAQGQISQRERRSKEYRREDLEQGISFDLVAIPGGTFTMGSPASEAERLDSEGPQHQVTVQPFLMGKYLVTQAQWKAVAALPKRERDLNPAPANCKGGTLPVEQVSWDDAVEFCQRLSTQTGREYRLPSEAEWEYACRAGTTTPFHFGETITTELANYDGNYSYGSGPKGEYPKQTTEVGRFSANGFDLYDIHGNVYEWCLDYWHETYHGAPADGSAWTTGGDHTKRLLRGGSWNDNPRLCRSALRFRVAHDRRFNGIGFRVACASLWAF